MKFALSVPPSEPRTRDSGDPLGFRSIVERMARDIAPGLTQSTSLTRGFSMSCLGLRVAKDLSHSRKAKVEVDAGFLRFETWVVLCLTQHDQRCRLPGKQRAKQYLAAAGHVRGFRVDLDQQRLLRNQLATGLWGLYRRSAMTHGLLTRQPGPRHSRPSAHALTTYGRGSGEALAQAARETLTDSGSWQIGPLLRYGTVTDADLKQLPYGDEPSDDEVLQLGLALGRSDALRGAPLGRLHDSFDRANGELSLRSVHVSMLTPAQAAAVRAARLLRPIMREFETSLRAVITEEQPKKVSSSSLSLLSKGLFSSWDPGAYIPMLVAHCESNGVIDGLVAHHRSLYEQRGSTPWEIGDSDPSKLVERYRDPDIGLSAPANLFREGVIPR